jgi:hypothetical protein
MSEVGYSLIQILNSACCLFCIFIPQKT